MELNTIADIKLVGRAMREDWPTPIETKQEAVNALMDVIRLRDPELSIAAFTALVKADLANIKNAELEAKERERDEQRRLRILEFLRAIGPDEVGRLASASGVNLCGTEVGRKEVRPRAKAKAASKRKGTVHPRAKKSKAKK